MTTKKLSLILLLIAFIVVGLIITFSNPFTLNFLTLLDENSKIKDTIRFEIVKSLLQLLVVTIIGGIIAQLFKAAEFTKQQAQVFLNLRMDFLKRLGVLYSAVKLSRRELRAIGLTTKFGDNPNIDTKEKRQVYIDQMKRLNELQLSLEDLKREAQSSPALFSFKSLSNEVKRMEDYLRQILNEFAQVHPRLKEANNIELTELERLNEFTCSTKQQFQFNRYNSKTDYRFKTHFSQAYDKIISIFTE